MMRPSGKRNGERNIFSRAGIVILLSFIGAWVVRGIGLAAVTLVSFTTTPKDGQVQLDWQTASEIDFAGFFVRRSTDESGAYSRISPFIPTEGDSIVGANYSYLDSEVVNGITYYYQLEAVNNDQSSDLFGPVSAVPGITPTSTATSIPMGTATSTVTASASSTPTSSSTQMATLPPGATPSATRTPTKTITPTTRTPTAAHTTTATSTVTFTPLPSPTYTPFVIVLPTLALPTSSVTASPTATLSAGEGGEMAGGFFQRLPMAVRLTLVVLGIGVVGGGVLAGVFYYLAVLRGSG